MSQSEVLKATKRTQLGSNASRKLRAEGRIPANLQADADHPHLDIAVDEHQFLAARRHHVHLYDIDVEGDVQSALVRELQWDTFGDRLLHVEFKRVMRGVETESEVELEFFGHPKSNGMVNHLLTHVTIRSLPSQIPDVITIRVGDLDVGDHIKAKDLVLPEGVSLAIDPDTDVATIAGAAHEEIEEEGAEGEEPSEPEIIGRKKDEEDEEGSDKD